MRTTTTITSLVVLLWAALAKTSAAEEDLAVSARGPEEGFSTLHFGDGGFPSFELLPTGADKNDQQTTETTSSSSSSLRGAQAQQLDLPPIPPIHPVHTGSVQYSSMMDADGTVTYRRDIHAPCNFGILVFNIGPSKDDLPYHWDVYADAYIWSDNGGLCILYPTYTGYQVSSHGPFWRPGYDATTIKFTHLTSRFKSMHRISSRMLEPPEGAPSHSREIDHNKGGDYVMMSKGNFYTIDFYKRLKDFVNSWGPNGWGPDSFEEAWAVWDAAAQEANSKSPTIATTTTTTTALVSKTQ